MSLAFFSYNLQLKSLSSRPISVSIKLPRRRTSERGYCNYFCSFVEPTKLAGIATKYSRSVIILKIIFDNYLILSLTITLVKDNYLCRAHQAGGICFNCNQVLSKCKIILTLDNWTPLFLLNGRQAVNLSFKTTWTKDSSSVQFYFHYTSLS